MYNAATTATYNEAIHTEVTYSAAMYTSVMYTAVFIWKSYALHLNTLH